MTDFIPVFIEITRQPEIKMTDAAVFGAIWFYSFKGEGACSKKPETIGKAIGCSANTVRAAIKKLCDTGYIEDLTPEIRHTTHEFRPTKTALDMLPDSARLPEIGNQKQVTRNETGYQKQATRLPEIGNQNGDRLPEIGNDNNKDNKDNNLSPSGDEKHRTRKPTERNLAIGELSKEFTRITGIKEPTRKKDKGFWFGSLGELYEIAERDVDIGKKLIEFTAKKLWKKEMEVNRPESLVVTARGVMAERNRQRKTDLSKQSIDRPFEGSIVLG